MSESVNQTPAPEPAAPKEEDRFKRVVAISIAAVTVLAAIVGFLQDQAGTQAAKADRSARRYGTEAMGQRTAGQVQKGFGVSTAQSWFELGKLAAAANRQGDADAVRRYQAAQEHIAQLSPLLTDTYQLDVRKYETDLYIARTVELTERSTAAAQVSTAWGNKQSTYIFNLTFIAVALALLGLSTAIESESRRVFVIAATIILAGCLLWTGATIATPIPSTNEDAILAYARGVGLAYQNQPEAAIKELNQALERQPGYANALYERADAHVALREYQKAVDDYQAAQRAGRNDAGLYWNLGWTHYLLGQFDEAIRADQRAVALKPDLIPVRLNLALAYLAFNHFDEARQEYSAIQQELARQVTEAHDQGRALPYSFWLYLDIGAQDIDSLLDQLDDKPRPWTLAPPSEVLSQPDALRAAAQDILVQLKSLSVALEYTGAAPQGEVAAQITPFKFGLFQGGLGGGGAAEDYVSVTGVRAATPFEAGTPFDLERKTYFPYAAEQPDLAITRTQDFNDPLSYRLADAFPMDLFELMSLLFDYQNMRNGQQVLWKVYANGQEDLSMRREQMWDLGERGGAEKYFSFMFGGPGEYRVEMYVNTHLVQRGSFILSPTVESTATVTGTKPVDVTQTTSEDASIEFKGDRLHRISQGTLNQAVWSPDGKQIAVASSIGIYLYDAATLEYKDYIRSDEWIITISYSPDSKYILAGDAVGRVSLWNVAARAVSRSVSAHQGQVLQIAYSPDDSVMASAGADKVIRLWEGISGMQRHELRGHAEDVTGLSFSSDGKKLASSSRDKTVKIWDTQSGEELLTIEPGSDALFSVALSPDGTRVAFASADSSAVSVWDASGAGAGAGEALLTLNTGNTVVNSVSFSSDGSRIVTVGNDGIIQVWNAQSGEEALKLNDFANIYGASLSPDSKTLLTYGSDRVLRTWDATSGERANSTPGSFSTYVGSVAFTPNGATIVLGNDAGIVTLYNAESGQYELSTVAHDQSVSDIAFNPAIEQAASAGKDKIIRLWDAEFNSSQHTLEGHTGEVAAIDFNPDGTRLASASWDKTVKVWDASLGELLRTLEGHEYEVFGVAYSPDGKRIVTGSRDKTIKIWDAVTGELLRTLTEHSDTVFAVAFSPDGKQIASASYDATIKLWDAETGELLRTLEGHSGPVYVLVYSPDGKTLATGGADHTVRRWDATSGDLIETLEGHTWSVVSLAFNADGTRLISGGVDGTARIWYIQ